MGPTLRLFSPYFQFPRSTGRPHCPVSPIRRPHPTPPPLPPLLAEARGFLLATPQSRSSSSAARGSNGGLHRARAPPLPPASGAEDGNGKVQAAGPPRSSLPPRPAPSPLPLPLPLVVAPVPRARLHQAGRGGGGPGRRGGRG